MEGKSERRVERANESATASSNVGGQSEASRDWDDTESVIRNVLTSESFVEKLVLLLVTAILSGILVPLTINYVSFRTAAREKEREARRARDDSILQAQSKLLDEFSETALTAMTLALDVSWFKTQAAANDEYHKKAFARYSDRIVDLVAKWRALASRAQTLTSPAVSRKINAFLAMFFNEIDTPLNQLYNKSAATTEDWQRQHETNERTISDANRLIAEISHDLGLSKANLHQ